MGQDTNRLFLVENVILLDTIHGRLLGALKKQDYITHRPDSL
jgi:hypothetical protein